MAAGARRIAQTILGAIKTTYLSWKRDRAQRLSAALAFYAVFALTPLMVIVIAVAGRVFGQESVRGEVVGRIESLIGHGGAEQVDSMIRYAGAPRSSVLVSVIGIATLVLGAMAIFGELKDALDTIWEAVPTKRSGIWTYVRGNIISLGMVSAVTFLLLLTLVFSAAVTGFAKWADAMVPGSTVFTLRLADLLVSFSVTTVLFAMIYKILPEVRIPWRDVWIGAAATAVLFNLGKILLGLYLSRSNLASFFGAAGSLGVILVWIYYSTSVFLFGAEFTEVYSRHWGSRARP